MCFGWRWDHQRLRSDLVGWVVASGNPRYLWRTYAFKAGIQSEALKPAGCNKWNLCWPESWDFVCLGLTKTSCFWCLSFSSTLWQMSNDCSKSFLCQSLSGLFTKKECRLSPLFFNQTSMWISQKSKEKWFSTRCSSPLHPRKLTAGYPK